MDTAKLQSQLTLLNLDGSKAAQDRESEEIKNIPLFSPAVYAAIDAATGKADKLLPNYRLLGCRLPDAIARPEVNLTDDGLGDRGGAQSKEDGQDPHLYVNINAPWSAFICGSQGSGKSHTLSCLLENCLARTETLDGLAPPSPHLGPLSGPLAGLVFHYDDSSQEACEAAHLASIGVQVQVVVPLHRLDVAREVYRKVHPSIEVQGLLLNTKYLNAEALQRLMGLEPGESDGIPLYMEVVLDVIREMRGNPAATTAFDFADFKDRCYRKTDVRGQAGPLKQRFYLIEKFLTDTRAWVKPQARLRTAFDWATAPGTLTVLDLSDPSLTPDLACRVFNICLDIFQAENAAPGVAKVVALDEAHRYMKNTPAAARFTQTLIATIRMQRHYATRVAIATQEPTIAPALLDLCSISVVHRFTSPAWYRTLRAHLAAFAAVGGSGGGGSEEAVVVVGGKEELFGKIVELGAGEAIVSSPSAMVDVAVEGGGERPATATARKLGMRFLKMATRQRISADGGRSGLIDRAD